MPPFSVPSLFSLHRSRALKIGSRGVWYVMQPTSGTAATAVESEFATLSRQKTNDLGSLASRLRLTRYVDVLFLFFTTKHNYVQQYCCCNRWARTKLASREKRGFPVCVTPHNSTVQHTNTYLP